MRHASAHACAVPLVALLCLCAVPAAHAQNPAVESRLAGGDPLPALDQAAPASAATPLRYWKPDNLVRPGREWRYLREQAKAATKLLGEREDLRGIEAEAARVAASCEAGHTGLLGFLPDLQVRLAHRRAALSAPVTQAPVVAVSLDEAYTRLEPSALPPARPVTAREAVGMRGEQCAVGIS
jgi:hypothetical protein